MVRKVRIPREELKELYEARKMTTYQIARRYNCCQGTIWKRLHEFGIKLRLGGSPRVELSKEKLVKLYIDKKLSTWEIEKRYGYTRSTVYRKLLEYGIKPRGRAESHIIYERKNFSGDPLEKAYLIGFAIGDLRARKIYKNSETIHVDCGSTKPEQINLIKKLFEIYGRTWISRPGEKGKVQIEAFLNRSFDFFLDPKKEIQWILNSNDCFAAFLAGFTDAEGSIKIRNGRAVYQLGNYDKELLFLIHRKLMEIGINCPEPYEDNTKGYVTKQGYVHNQNYCSLHIHRKLSLLQLFELIGPYLKHEGRVSDMKKARENVQARNRMGSWRGPT